MARKIDFSKPLDEDEAKYVADRPWLLREAEAQGLSLILASDEDEDDDDTTTDDAAQEGSDDESDEDESDEDGDEDEEDDVDYDDLTVDELKDELRRRDLPVGGPKEQLIARLTEDDAAE